MIRVLIVDDQEMIRAGLRTILDSLPDIEVAGDAGDGFQAIQALENCVVDVVLMDLRMPGIDGVETTRRIRALYPVEKTKIIILTTFEHDKNVLEAVRAGANGFLGKSVGPADLAAGITEVAAGGGALSSAAAAAVIEEVSERRGPVVDHDLAQLFDSLTPREREVVVAIAAGHSNEEVAANMIVSPFTVKTHAVRAMTKVGARDRAQLIAFAYQSGIVR